MRLGLAAILLLTLASGCDYAPPDKWIDDPDNWGRAFSSEKPEDVVLVHSLYERTASFPSAREYWFEIEPGEEWKSWLFGGDECRQLEGEEAETRKTRACENAPWWFATESVQDYDIWIYTSKPLSGFSVLEDRESGNLFVCDYDS